VLVFHTLYLAFGLVSMAVSSLSTSSTLLSADDCVGESPGVVTSSGFPYRGDLGSGGSHSQSVSGVDVVSTAVSTSFGGDVVFPLNIEVLLGLRNIAGDRIVAKWADHSDFRGLVGQCLQRLLCLTPADCACPEYDRWKSLYLEVMSFRVYQELLFKCSSGCLDLPVVNLHRCKCGLSTVRSCSNCVTEEDKLRYFRIRKRLLSGWRQYRDFVSYTRVQVYQETFRFQVADLAYSLKSEDLDTECKVTFAHFEACLVQAALEVRGYPVGESCA
jgi:hypothetical protein